MLAVERRITFKMAITLTIKTLKQEKFTIECEPDSTVCVASNVREYAHARERGGSELARTSPPCPRAWAYANIQLGTSPRRMFWPAFVAVLHTCQPLPDSDTECGQIDASKPVCKIAVLLYSTTAYRPSFGTLIPATSPLQHYSPSYRAQAA